ncbi:MAG: M15 family metallopeptidase [bacterium]
MIFNKEKYMITVLKEILITLLIVIAFPSFSLLANQETKYNINGIVNILEINNRILVQLAYSKPDNFLHKDVYGDLEICYLRKEVAEKLDEAQKILEKKKKGYKLLVLDGLRPRDVQYKMWHEVKGTALQKYVANPERGSIHNFGAAVDCTIVDEHGVPLDMGSPFDYFGELSEPRHEKRLLQEGKLKQKHIENRKLLRSIMEEAGFQGILSEWWHFNSFSRDEIKQRYQIVEFILPMVKVRSIVDEVNDFPRDKNGFCLLIKGNEKKIYLIENSTIKLMFDIAIGQKGLGKTKEGDRKTPIGDYRIKWMLSRNGPSKQNPGGVSSFVIDGQTYAVLDTELYFGDLKKIRVKDFPDGTRTISNDPSARPITPEEIKIAQDEKLWTNSYGGENIYVMALDYPNEQDRAEGKTGSCIEIHASANLERVKYRNYKGTYGCVSMYSYYARRIYEHVNPKTPVRIVK